VANVAAGTGGGSLGRERPLSAGTRSTSTATRHVPAHRQFLTHKPTTRSKPAPAPIPAHGQGARAAGLPLRQS
jgi:hypothetical protein